MFKTKQRIDWVLTHESVYREIILNALLMGDPSSDAVAWSTVLLRKRIPDIEIYIDKLVISIMPVVKELNKDKDEEFIRKSVINAINLVLLHELLHDIGEVIDEDSVDAAVMALFDGLKMTWHYIPCPKSGSFVTWKGCIGCDDSEKYEECPLQVIRLDAYKRLREFVPKVYHVTELNKVRYSFYERWHSTAMSWEEYWALFWGQAIGKYVEDLHEYRTTTQFEFDVSAEQLAKFAGVPSEPDDDFRVVGHADVVDVVRGALLELKVQYNLKYVTQAPNPTHVFQTKAYYTLGLIQHPEIFKKIERAHIVYFGRQGRSKKVPPYKEHFVALEPVDLLTPARMLRRAEVSDVPPLIMCESWLCANCPHKALCDTGAGRLDGEQK